MWRRGQPTWGVSWQLAEVDRALAYPKIRERLHRSVETITRFVEEMRYKSTVVHLVGALVPASLRDPHDALILAATVLGDADVIVTGDAALFVLADQYPVESPAPFTRRL